MRRSSEACGLSTWGKDMQQTISSQHLDQKQCLQGICRLVDGVLVGYYKLDMQQKCDCR